MKRLLPDCARSGPACRPAPAGTGKTLIARACAAQTNATFLKLAGPTLVQMFIGDGAKMVRDAFALAKEKAPAIIFIDEIDAIGAWGRAALAGGWGGAGGCRWLPRVSLAQAAASARWAHPLP